MRWCRGAIQRFPGSSRMGRRWPWRRRGKDEARGSRFELLMIQEIVEAFRIAFNVIRAHKMRSMLTALGVIIGIVAVTMMGSAIAGIEIGLERSLAVIGDDLLYVENCP